MIVLSAAVYAFLYVCPAGLGGEQFVFFGPPSHVIVNDPSKEMRPELSTLLVQLRDESAAVRANAANDLSAFPSQVTVDAIIVSVRKEKDITVKKALVDTLGKIGKEATKALPTIVSVLTDPGSFDPRITNCCLGPATTDCLSCHAAAAMVRIGSASAVPLADIVLNQHYHMVLRITALRAISQLKTDAKAAVPFLIEATTDPEVEIRSLSVVVLPYVAPEMLSAKRALLGALADSAVTVRLEAAMGLSLVDKKSPIPVSVLTDLLGEQDTDIQYRAATALRKIGPSAASSRTSLVSLLKSSVPSARIAGIEAIGAFGEQSTDMLVELQRMLKDPDANVRDAAEFAIKKIKRN